MHDRPVIANNTPWGVLLAAKERRLVSDLSALLGDLQDAGLYLDAELIAQVLRLAGEE
ncbi:MAG TPA: DUF3368 domain-containing protein [Chloroflexi bacterium]|nr:DUF3368 domain-containing protein [Chloroflexota bacterium]